MSTRDGYEDGTFCWVDLMSPDTARAAKFYADLFAWEADTQPTDEQGQQYTIFKLRGKAVAGMGKQPDAMRSAGAPAVWNSYVQVADVRATETAIQKLGGSVVMGAMKVMDAGEMGVYAAPDGSVFSVWQPGLHKGSELANEPGALGWNELVTDDVNGAMKFYGGVFGWRFAQFGMPDYHLIGNGDMMNGGVMPKRAEMAAVPNVWSVYFVVEDTDASMKRVVELGGKTLTDAMEIPEVGRFAVCADSQGGTFTIIKMDGPEMLEMPDAAKS